MPRGKNERRPYLKSPRCILRLKTVRLAMYPGQENAPTVEIIPRQGRSSGFGPTFARSVYRLSRQGAFSHWVLVEGPDIDDDLIWELVWSVHQSYAQSEYLIRSANRAQELAG